VKLAVLIITSILVASSAIGLVVNIKNCLKSESPALAIVIATILHGLIISGILYLGAV
jgi:hypothetical protein